MGQCAFLYTGLTSVTIDKTMEEVEEMGYQNWGLGIAKELINGIYTQVADHQVIIRCTDGNIVINEGM